MRNSNVVFRTIVILVLVCSTIFSIAKAQFENPEEVITVSQGQSLKVKHALSVLTFMQSQGSLSQNPTEGEVQAVLEFLLKEFQAAPLATIQEIENMTQFNQPTQSTPPTPQQRTDHRHNVASDPQSVSNQKQAEQEIARVYKSHFPQAVIDYNNAQAQQVKEALKGVLLVNNSSKTYNSGSGDNYFGMTTASSMNLHICQNGIMTIESDSRMMGGGNYGSLDSGSGGNILQCWWSIALVNGQLCIMTADAQGVDALPLFIENESIMISDKRYTVHQGQAQCQY